MHDVRRCCRALLLLSGLGTSGCVLRTDTTVEIQNVSARGLLDVVLEAGGDRVEVEHLAPGSRHIFRPEVSGDSGVRIMYVEAGRSKSCEGDVYLTNNMYARIEAEIGGGVCRVVDVTR